MAAEPVNNSGFFTSLTAEKKKREDDYAAAVAAMIAATDRLQSITSNDTAISPESDASGSSAPLLRGLSSHRWATTTLEIIEKLKIENPLNTKLLTEVLINTAAYINHEQDKKAKLRLENDPAILNAYTATREKVDKVYGRFSALSIALLGIPASILVGGIAGTIILALAFPPAAAGILLMGTIACVFAACAGLIVPAETKSISNAWENLGKDLNQSPSFGR